MKIYIMYMHDYHDLEVRRELGMAESPNIIWKFFLVGANFQPKNLLGLIFDVQIDFKVDLDLVGAWNINHESMSFIQIFIPFC